MLKQMLQVFWGVFRFTGDLYAAWRSAWSYREVWLKFNAERRARGIEEKRHG